MGGKWGFGGEAPKKILVNSTKFCQIPTNDGRFPSKIRLRSGEFSAAKTRLLEPSLFAEQQASSLSFAPNIELCLDSLTIHFSSIASVLKTHPELFDSIEVSELEDVRSDDMEIMEVEAPH